MASPSHALLHGSVVVEKGSPRWHESSSTASPNDTPAARDAVSDLNMEVEDHEFLVLVGPSGCGKSTAMRMVAGLEEISGGRIIIGDRVVNDLPPKDRDVAMVFQSYALYPHMTVRDNLAYPPEAAQGAQGAARKDGSRSRPHARHH